MITRSPKPGTPPKQNVIRKLLKRAAMVVAGLAIVAVVAAGALYAYVRIMPLHFPQVPYEFSIGRGSTLHGVARQLTRVGVLYEPWTFIALGRVLHKAGSIKAGNYEIDKPVSLYRLLLNITEGGYSEDSIAFIDGWTFRQIREQLNADPELRHDTATLTDAEILTKLDIPYSSPEGLFFPNTYFFSQNTSDLLILKRAYHLMQERLTQAWKSRAPDLPLTKPYQALILASIVEKETGRPQDRAEIAAVFVNRLRRGMKLQTDPTVIFGMGNTFDGNLRRQDLTTDTPYNTYMHAGLPPTPIAIPGMESIDAAVHPAHTDALYFVAAGDGSSHFSSTLNDHNRAVEKYQKSNPRH
ncbi:MAG TPA: endolytic transglycosylase MltG [Burkholderiales bacterium]|nr:endolytic transglycosylase MltG [Burkholderiales bacterium]